MRLSRQLQLPQTGHLVQQGRATPQPQVSNSTICMRCRFSMRWPSGAPCWLGHGSYLCSLTDRGGWWQKDSTAASVEGYIMPVHTVACPRSAALFNEVDCRQLEDPGQGGGRSGRARVRSERLLSMHACPPGCQHDGGVRGHCWQALQWKRPTADRAKPQRFFSEDLRHSCNLIFINAALNLGH